MLLLVILVLLILLLPLLLLLLLLLLLFLLLLALLLFLPVLLLLLLLKTAGSPDTLHTHLHAVGGARTAHAHLTLRAGHPITHDLVRLGVPLCIYTYVYTCNQLRVGLNRIHRRLRHHSGSPFSILLPRPSIPSSSPHAGRAPLLLTRRKLVSAFSVGVKVVVTARTGLSSDVAVYCIVMVGNRHVRC